MTGTFYLCWVNREGGEVVFHVRGGATLGRSPASEIPVDADGVSRVHCRLEAREGKLVVQDLGSTNGTYVNGRRVQEAEVKAGDELLVGRCRFQVRVEEPARPEASAAGAETIEVALEAARADYPGGLEGGARAADHLRVLARVLEAINAGGAPEDLYRRSLEAILEALDVDFGAVVLGTDPKAAPAAVRLRRGAEAAPGPAPSSTVLARVLATGEAVLANDAAVDGRLRAAHSLAGAGATRILCAPIALAGRISGALYVAAGAGSRPLAESELRLVTLVARQLALAAENLRRQELVLAENRSLRDQAAGDLCIVGPSPQLARVLEMARRAARTDVTVLITGETGTGKELIARAIHEWSARRRQPFIAVNCGAIPATMVESELFGHEKGAFTGAAERRLGRFELARDGTLFLDEIGELPFELQVKLLRVLEEKSFYRVGGSKEISSDVRVIAATNRDLAERARAGRFRDDLFYRIRVLEIAVPPLRERREDIRPIAEHLLARLAAESGRPRPDLGAEVAARLAAYDWPGNVRELRNVLERALILGAGDVLAADDVLPELAGAERAAAELGAAGARPLASLRDLEKEHIRAVLVATGWNKSRAAEILGIGRTNIYEKIKLYGLEPER